MKYSDIKDLASLDIARAQIASEISIQKERLKPVSLLTYAAKGVYGGSPLNKLALTGVRVLKKKLTSKPESEKKKAEEGR